MLYTPSEPDHYLTFLAVSAQATPRSVFDRAQEAFKQSADKTGKVFDTSTIHQAPEFSVDYAVDMRQCRLAMRRKASPKSARRCVTVSRLGNRSSSTPMEL